MKHLTLIILLTALACISFAETPSRCLSQDNSQKILRLFNFQRWDGTQFVNNESPLCNPEDSLYKTVEALLFMEQQNNIVSSAESVVATEGPLNYFSRRVQKIIIEDKPLFNLCERGTYVAYVRNGVNNTTFICADKFNSLSSFQRAVVLIHEARHIDGFPHTDCTHGTMKLFGAARLSCDKTFQEQGSYGVQAGYALYVTKTTTDPVLKQEARAEAIDLLLNRFNQLPLDLKQGIVTHDYDNVLSFFDGKAAITLFPLTKKTVLVSRFLVPTLFSHDGSVTSFTYTPEKFISTSGDLAEKFRNGRLPLDRSQLITIDYGLSDYSCALYNSALYCEDDKNHILINFKKIKPKALLQVPVPSLALSIVDTDGSIYQLPEDFKNLESWKEELLKSGKTKTAVFQSVEVGATILGLNFSQQLVQYSTKSKKWEIVPVLKSKRFKTIVPYTWSKQLENL